MTASGKTKAAIQLAKKIDAEIISADSRIVYKNIDIAGAKPNKDELREVKHHLIDVVELDMEFSAGDFCALAKEKIIEIQSRNKNIIVAGGTWFYIKCLFDNEKLLEVGINKELRNELAKLNSKQLWEKLDKLDSVRAKVIHPNNKDKIIRSIELCVALNKPVTMVKREENAISAPWYMIDMDRQTLYERINNRVDIMFEDGLYDEWEKNKLNYPNSKVLLNTIGYKELFDFEKGKYKTLDEAKEKIKQHTRNFAKRQLTYFRNNYDITKIKSVDEIDLISI